MATIQEIKTRFTSEGGQKVAKDAENIGRAQTRMGQASASAGRAFAAQANGLGGLVGIYAAAAANVFAITAAFTALNRAAQFGTIIQGTQSLAQAVGSTATEVVASLKSVTDGQLSIVEAATQANLALSAGFNTDQIEQLGSVALKASRALGRNLTDSFQRITRGAIKLEPELLDEIGIFTRIEPAVEAYANQLNKSVSQLTQFERRQAFVNQVIKDGEAAFADIEGNGKTTQEVFEALVANFTDLALVVGKFLADSLVPLAEFLDKNLGNRLILLGAIGTLVFGKLKEAVAGFATAGLTALSARLSDVADGFANVTKLGDDFAKKQKAASALFVGQGAIAGPRGQGAQIKRDLQAGPISTARAQEIQKELPGLLQAERDRRKQIKDQISAGNLEIEKGNKQLAQSQARSKGLLATNRLITIQLKSSGVAANILAKGLRGAGVAANFLGKQLNRAFGLLNAVLIGFTILQTALSFFDIDLFSEIKDLIASINKEAKDTAKGFEAINAAARKAGEGVGFMAQQARFLQVPDENLQSITEAVNRINELTDAQKANAIARLQNELATLQAGLGFLQLRFGDDVDKRIEDIESILAILNDVEKSEAAKTIAETANAVTTLGEMIASKLDAPSQEIIDQLGRLVNEGILAVRDGALQVSDSPLFSGGINFGAIDDLTTDLADVARITADASVKFDTLNTKLQEGGITASRASRDVGVVTSMLTRSAEAVQKEIDRLGPNANTAGLRKQLMQINDALQLVRDTTQETVNQFTALDQLGKQLGKTFGGDFKALDERFLTGDVSATTGKIARNAEEQQLFQAQNLQVMRQQLKTLEQQGGTESEINILKENIVKSAKASQAENLRMVKTTEQIRLNEEKRFFAIERQLKLQKAQNELNRKLAASQLANLQGQGDVKFQEQQSKLAEKAAELAQARADTAAKARDAEKEILELQIQSAKAARERNSEALAFAVGQARAADDRELLTLRQSIAAQEQRSLTMEEDRIQNRIKILDKEKENALNELNGRRALLIDEINNERATFVERKKLLDKELEMNEAARKDALNTLAREEANFERGLAIEEFKRKQEEAAIRRTVEDAKARKEFADLQADLQFEAKKQELDLLDKKYALLEATIATNAANIAAEEKLLIEKARLAKVPAGVGAVASTFESGTEESRTNIQTARSGLAGSLGNLEKIRDDQKQAAQDQLDQARKIADEKLSQLQDERNFAENNAVIQRQIFRERERQINEEFTKNRFLLREKLDALEDERAHFEDLSAKKLQGLDEEAAAIEKDFAARKAALEFLTSAQHRYLETLRAVRDVISNEIGTVVQHLFQNIADGKNVLDDFGETLRNTFENVRKKVLEKTLIEPLQRQFEGAFNSFFNIAEEKKVEDALTSSAGGPALRTIDVSGTSDAIKEVMDKDNGVINAAFTNIEEGVTSFGDKVSQTFSDLGTGAKDVFSGVLEAFKGAGSGGGLGSIFSSLGGMFGGGGGASGPSVTGASIGASPFAGGPPIAVASGGLVRKMAAGGMLRDRVPALLEPGEFVMKRSAANGIGEPALNRMNSTGSMGGNVSVNINNQGTPQEATASAPKFDGEKFVIDIVTRDLRNNGPIRKSLRAGGGS